MKTENFHTVARASFVTRAPLSKNFPPPDQERQAYHVRGGLGQEERMRAVEPSLQQKPGEDGYPHRESGHVAPHDRPGPLPRYQVVPRYGAGAFGEYEEGEDGRQPFQGDAVVEVLQEPAARKKRTRPHDGEEDGEGRGRVDRLPLRGPAASEANFMRACMTKPPPMITARISMVFPSEKAA